MKVLELFAGTRSIGKAFEAHGHQVFSVEWDKSFENIDLYEDVLKVTPEEIVKRFGRRRDLGQPRLHDVQYSRDQPPQETRGGRTWTLFQSTRSSATA